VVVERHARAELAADERLARDRERGLPRPGIAKAAGAKRHRVLLCDSVDEPFVDDPAVRMQEVERDRAAAALDVARAVDDRGRGSARVPQLGEDAEEPAG